MLEAALVLTLPLFSTATLFVGLLAFGALLFMRSRQDPHAPHRSFLLQYAFGFFFFAFVGLPAVLINLHLSGSFNFIKLFYSISLGAILLTSLFFYRASVSVFTKSRIIRDLFPTAAVVGFLFIFLTLFLEEREQAPTLIGLFLASLALPRDLFFASAFLHFFIYGFHGPDTKLRVGSLLVTVGWIIIFVLDVAVWFLLFRYPPEFWAIRLSSLGLWYFFRFLATVLLFVGFLPLPPQRKAFFEP